MKYKICNKVIEFNFLDNLYFENIFKKYQIIDNLNTDIYINSKLVSNLDFLNTDVLISGEMHKVLMHNGYKYYIFLNKGMDFAAVKLDNENGNYECFLVCEKNAYYFEYIILQCILSSYFSYHNNSIFIHSSCIKYNDSAIMFSALSGTGKSTQARLWHEYKNSSYINDDKNLIFLENNHLVVYGTPLSGKHHLDENVKGNLKAIVFIKQSKTNAVKKLSKMDAYIQLLNQTQRPIDNDDDAKMDLMINKILDLPIYELSCNVSTDAVDTLYNEIFKENE